MDRLDKTQLSQAENKLRFGSSCSHLIPEEFSRSVPVPFKIKKRGEMGFKVLFYPVATESENPSMASSPLVEGIFSLDGSVPDHCVSMADQKGQVLRRSAPPRMSMVSYYRGKSLLYENLESIAPLYFSGAPLNEKNLKDIGAFVQEFKLVSDPGLWANYYHLSPDFWNWIKQSGQTLPDFPPLQ